MDEREWRQLAEAIQPHLRVLFASEKMALQVEMALAAALAAPQSRAELRRVLLGHDETKQWIRRQREARRHGYRSASVPVEEPERYLEAQFPQQAALGSRVPLIARIVRTYQGVALRRFEIGPRGAVVSISVITSEGLQTHGDLDQDVTVPPNADSDPCRFAFTLTSPGSHKVLVRAFLGGTFLGELSLRISVEAGVATEDGEVHRVALPIEREPGEVTLEVTKQAEGYLFRLHCDTPYERELSRRLGPDVSTVADQIATEVRAMAIDRSPYASGRQVRRRLANLGAQLWQDAVPEAIQRQIHEQSSAITSLSVLSNLDTTPWELLYLGRDAGFLVDRFPVVRRIERQPLARRFRFANAAYVLSEKFPAGAAKELKAVRTRVGAGAVDRGVYVRQDKLCDLIMDGTVNLIHFACHNGFDADTGSSMRMNDGPFDPKDLSTAALDGTLRDASPLVFFNACRSSDQVPTLTGMSGWANGFLRAGAGAFVGTLWAVRSMAAGVFADAFYRALLDERQSLGQASMTARQAVMADEGDPTWLSYSVYGNPAAVVDPL